MPVMRLSGFGVKGTGDCEQHETQEYLRQLLVRRLFHSFRLFARCSHSIIAYRTSFANQLTHACMGIRMTGSW